MGVLSSNIAFAASHAGQTMTPEQQMKMQQKMMKMFPVPVPAGSFAISAFPIPGKGLFSYKHVTVAVKGVIQGSSSVGDAEVTNVANEFFGQPNQPPKLRLAPESVDVTVDSFGYNYGLNPKTALVIGVPYFKKELKTVTFQGGTGSTRLAVDSNTTSGLGDIKAGAIFKVHGDDTHHIYVPAILNIPTGSLDNKGTYTTPSNTTMTVRNGYGMQLGSGTYDLITGVSYWGRDKNRGWGSQLLVTKRLQDKNKEDYRFGDVTQLNAWYSYGVNKALVLSTKLSYENEGSLKGQDPKIIGPSVGAQTANYGGTRTSLSLGMNFMPKIGHNLSFEYNKPISQNRNGVQGELDSVLYFNYRVML